MTREYNDNVVRLIRVLTQDEMTAVKIFNENPDFTTPNMIIQIEWFDFSSMETRTKEIDGDSLKDCLERACRHKSICPCCEVAGTQHHLDWCMENDSQKT